jgi:uncharacterized protein
MRQFFTVIFFLLVLSVLLLVRGQTRSDQKLFAEISKIHAIDNHAHPLKYVATGEKADDEFDALPLDAIEEFPLPVRLSPTNPEFIGAWHALYQYSYNDMSELHVRELLGVKQRIMNERQDGYPAWVLDQLNIETMLANRIALGRGLTAPRFRWVPFDDALIFPLSNVAAEQSNRDYSGFYPAEERLLKRYLADLNLSALPASLNEYLANVVKPTLLRQKQNGAIAVKFEAAYLRKLDFDHPNESRARAIYLRYVKSGVAPPADYKVLQDFLFYYIARESGALGMAVHIHCIAGFGGYYRQSGSDPLLLETILNEQELRKTNFVILHGGYPFTKQTASLLSKPNVYADFSAQTFVTYPRELSEILRNWLESYPDKILFGTDAFSFGPEVGWPEVAWLSNTTARQALALALQGMIDDGEISSVRALELARMVLRENALKLYHL